MDSEIYIDGAIGAAIYGVDTEELARERARLEERQAELQRDLDSVRNHLAVLKAVEKIRPAR